MERGNQWFDLLPKELLVLIFQRLDRIDVLRLRAVCKSWRYSILDFLQKEKSIRSPLKLPGFLLSKEELLRSPPEFLPLIHPFHLISGHSITVTESTVYRLEPSQKNPNASMVVGEASSSSSSSSYKGILVKVKAEGPNEVRLLPPLSELGDIWHRKFLKNLNLLGLRFSEISKVYEKESLPRNMTKVAVLFPDPMRATADGYAVMAIFNYGRLYFLKSGDEEWTAIHEQAEQQSDYTDVINHKGKFYAVTDTGGAIAIDSFRQVSEIAHPIRDGDVIASLQIANPQLGGHQMHLVESLGDLLLVDGHTFWDKFKVYKLDEEEREWVEMRSLGDQVVFMDRHSSFSVSARDLTGCKANSIYYRGMYRVVAWSVVDARPLRMMPTSVFNLEDGRVPDEDLGLPDEEALSWALKAHIGKKKKKKEKERRRRRNKKTRGWW